MADERGKYLVKRTGTYHKSFEDALADAQKVCEMGEHVDIVCVHDWKADRVLAFVVRTADGDIETARLS